MTTALRYIPAFNRELFACVSGADACTSTTWDDCFGQVIGNFPVRPIDQTLWEACMSKHKTCPPDGISVASNCLFVNVLSESTIQALLACFRIQSCPAVEACLEQDSG